MFSAGNAPEPAPSLGDPCLQEESPGDPQIRGSVRHRGDPLAAAPLPLPHLHHRLLQPVERGENLWEGEEGSCQGRRDPSAPTHLPVEEGKSPPPSPCT